MIAVIFNVLILVIVFGAILCSIAMRNTPLIIDSAIVMISRNLGIGGWVVVWLELAYKMIFIEGLHDTPAPLRIGLTVLALGTNVKTIGQLIELRTRATTPATHQHRRAGDPIMNFLGADDEHN